MAKAAPGKTRNKPEQAGQKLKKKRKRELGHQDHQKQPDVEQDMGVEHVLELEDDDYALLAEFGDRIDFLTGAASLAHDPAATPRKRKREQAALDSKKRKQATDDSHIVQEEEVYEKESRKVKKKPQADVVDLLPFKAADGSLVYDKSRSADARAMAMHVEGVRIDDDAMTEEDDDDEEEAEEVSAAAQRSRMAEAQGHPADKALGEHRSAGKPQKRRSKEGQEDRSSALRSAHVFHSRVVRRPSLQQQIAEHSSKLLEDPESNLSSLKCLLELTLDGDSVVQRLALLSLASIFKDILPGFRIRDLTDEERAVKVTKAVQKLRDYESALLRGFQSYVKVLRSLLAPRKHAINTHRVAVKCLGELLTSVSHFNCMHEVLEALVHSACGMDARCRAYACAALEALLRQPQPTDVMVDAVQLAVDAVRSSKCVCPPDIAYALMAVKFKDLSRDDVEKGSMALKKKFKYKTRRRREDAIAAALQEAAIAAEKDQVRLHQIQILEALFEMFFRVLKRCTASGLLHTPPHASCTPGTGGAVVEVSPETIQKKWPLLPATLQGLAKYTHLIGLEYFNDLMEVLQQLLGAASLPLELRMRCLLTTVDILRAQNDALNVDRRRLYAHLYNALAVCALEPIGDDGEEHEGQLKSEPQVMPAAEGQGRAVRGFGGGAHRDRKGGSEGQGASRHGGASSCSVLVAKATAQLLAALKPGDAARVGAFVKRMCACALHADPGLCLALLAVTARLLQRHTKLHGLLDGEATGSYGQGGYDPFQSDPTDARALCSSLWELSALLRHCNKEVADAARSISGIADGTSTAADLRHAGKEPHEIVEKLGGGVDMAVGSMPAPARRAGSNGKRSKIKADKLLRGRAACPEASPVVTANIWCYLGPNTAAVECCREERAPHVLHAAQQFQSMFGEDLTQRRMRADLHQARKALFNL